MKFVDFHSHHPEIDPEVFSLYCHADIAKDLPPFTRNEPCFFSAGLHPWYLPTTTDEVDQAMAVLLKILTEPNSIGLGECGLDRLRGPDIKIQSYALEKQLAFARDNKYSLVIFHCVRAYPECLSLLKKSRYGGKVVFHDYGANAELTKQILAFEQCYFSLGNALERKYFIENTLPLLPLERVVLETDDLENLSIKVRYRQLSEALKLPLEDISTTLYKNTLNLLSHLPNLVL